MAIERDFITPAGVTVLTTANVVGNTTTADMFSNTQRSTVYPELQLNFAKAGYLDPRVTFSRSSVATYIDQFDVIRTANNDIPRFEHANGVCQGLLVEESRTNIFLNGPTLYGARRVPGTAIGPDNNVAQAIILDRGYQQFNGFGGGAYQPFSLAAGASVDIHFTGFFGPQFGSQVQTADIIFAIDLNSNGTNVVYSEWVYNFNANTTVYRYTGTSCTELSATITPHPNGMNKLTWSIRYTQDGTPRNSIGTGLQIRDSAGGGQYIADGVSGIQYACCQVEIGNQPTSYIPTGATSVTRAADYAYVVADKYNFNPKQGTFFVRAKSTKANTPSQQGGNDAAAFFNLLDSWEQTQNDQLGVSLSNDTRAISAFTSRQGLGYRYSSIANTALSITPNTFVSAAVSYYASNTFVITANGVVGTAGNYHRPVGNQITSNQTIFNIGNGYNFTQRSINGPIAKIAYYTSPLSNTQLQAITT